MNILIIDDEEIFNEKLKKDLWNFFFKYDDNICIDMFLTMKEEIPLLKYQLAFLDIDLRIENYTGIDIARQLGRINPSCYIIFVSAKNDLIHSSLHVQPFFFIRKSNYLVDLDAFFILFKNKIKKNQVIKLKYSYDQHIVKLENIIYIKAQDHHCTVYTQHRSLQDYNTLKSLLQKLPKDKFVQIHRSLIINLDYVVKHTRTTVILLADENSTIEFSIGRAYKKYFHIAYKEKLLR